MLIAQGLSNREIANVLLIGEGTAGNHGQHILEKLQFHSRAQIASWVTGHINPLSQLAAR
jgi:non-specific serine/threonine protein kinase